MSDIIQLHYDVDGTDFAAAGEASMKIKKELRSLGFPQDVIRRIAIAVYEGEINMVIHADGGTADVNVGLDEIEIILADTGPGIPDVEKAMQKGWSTASEEVRNSGFGAGMGLPNMKKNTDEMVIDTEVGVGTTIRMKVYVA
ncbi:MAG: ATP-binding protein [Clostridia bacterium]|nr:ATP-binding protein [Clostridia bacterium]MBQ8469502.1 ATP-binding protein [Clostridia bacterium]MBR1703970.1 ATP-binding protein [Clostridia bacterium]